MLLRGCLSALTALLIALLGSSAQALTKEEAHSMPLQALAVKVLGEVGAGLVVDVDRPAWPDCTRWRSPACDMDHSQAPPLTYLVFHLRAAGSGSNGWWGLCEGRRIHVFFDSAGRVESLWPEATIGSSGPLERAETTHEAFTKQSDRLEARCRSLSTTRSFFGADDVDEARAAAVAVWLVHHALLSGSSVPLTCEAAGVFARDCKSKNGLASLAAEIDVGEITDVVSNRQHDGRALENHCYTMGLGRRGVESRWVSICTTGGEEPHVISVKSGRSQIMD